MQLIQTARTYRHRTRDYSSAGAARLPRARGGLPPGVAHRMQVARSTRRVESLRSRANSFS